MLYILKVFKYVNLKIRYLEYKLKVDACEGGEGPFPREPRL